MSRVRVLTVAVVSSTPLLKAGAACMLREDPHLWIASEPTSARVVVLVEQVCARPHLVHLTEVLDGAVIPCVLVAVRLDEEDLPLAVECGVVQVLNRDSITQPQLVAAVRAACLPKADGPLSLAEVATSPVLTDRECELLRGISEGLSCEQIAARLHCSERTVKNVLRSVLARLRLNNRAQAVAYAIREGVI